MKSSFTRIVETTLTLNAQETYYLKSLVQNYLGKGKESDEHRKIRMDIWNALPSFEQLQGEPLPTEGGDDT